MAQVGIASGALLRDHGHSMSGDGAQLNPDTALNPQPEVDFGDGSDGDVTIAVNSVLTRDMCYNNLIINNGCLLVVKGFVVKVKGKYTKIGGGPGLWASGNGGGNGAAGVGGPGGAAFLPNRLPFQCLPTAGAKGADAGAAGAVISIGGIAPDTHLDPNVPGLIAGSFWAGAGGGGGGSVGDGVAVGGVPLRVLQGAKGGNGADGIRIALNHTKGGGGGGSGGAGVELWAHEIDNQGNFYAEGGSGGNGEGDANAQAGGGGGGGGGRILIFYKILSGFGLGGMLVTGGPGGTSFGGVADGLPGAAGFSYAMQIGV